MQDRESLIEEAEARGQVVVASIIRDHCYTTAEYVSETGYDLDFLKLMADREARYLYLEHEGSLYWPKFQNPRGGGPAFAATNALLHRLGHCPWSIYGFWTEGDSTSLDDVLRPNYDLLVSGQIRMVLHNAVCLMEQGGR